MRSDHATGHRSAAPVIERDDVEQLVAVIAATLLVHHDQPIAIAIQREPDIGAMGDDLLLQVPGMHGSDTGIDVEAVRLRAGGNHFGAQLVKHRRRDVVARAVCAIDDDLEALEVELVGKGALAELDVATARIVHAKSLSEIRRWHAVDRLIHGSLDRFFNRIGQLGAGLGEELDAVIFERIVRRADDDTCGESQRAREIRYRRSGQRSGEINVDARGRQYRFERRFQQVTRDARVLADKHRRRGARPARRFRCQHAPRGVPKAQNELRCDRRLAHAAANAVSTEIGLDHVMSNAPFTTAILHSHRLPVLTARHTLSASTVSRTSCARMMAAPRATAASAAATLPATRSLTSRPVSAPIVDLRESPTATG